MEKEKLGGPALRAFFNIADLWHLTKGEQMQLLGLSKPITLHGLRVQAERRESVAVDAKMMERISYVLGIYKAINTLLPDPQAADLWPRMANMHPAFDGRSALELMTSGDVEDLARVRRYLDAQLG